MKTNYNLQNHLSANHHLLIVTFLFFMLSLTNSYGQLSGTYTVGSGGSYATITTAVAAYNSNSLTGPVIFELTDASYPSETFPITINANASSSAVNTLTIRPQSGIVPLLSGSSSSSIIKLNGADWVILDGSNNNSSSKDWTISNTSTGVNSVAVHLASTGVGLGATNNVVKNLNISCGADQTTSTSTTYGIFMGSTTILNAGNDNDNNTISGNSIAKVNVGIFLSGVSGNRNDNNIISSNIIGPASFGSTQIGRAGMSIVSQEGVIITGNEIRFVGILLSQSASGGVGRVGISLSGGTAWTPATSDNTNSLISGNLIHDIIDEKGNSSVGIHSTNSTSPSNNVISNNVIYNVRSNGNTTSQAVGIGIARGSGDKIVYNSISMTGDLDPSGANTTVSSAAGIRISSTLVTSLTLANNAVHIDLNSNTSSLKHYGIVVPSSDYLWGSGFSNNNDIYVNPSNSQMVFGGLGPDYLPITRVGSLGGWKTVFTPNQDANSLSYAPLFTSTSNLLPLAGSPLASAAIPISGITTDYSGTTRSASVPTIGAYEISPASVNLGATSLFSPLYNGCYGAAETVTIAIKNFSSVAHNFNSDPATISVNVTGSVIYSSSVTLNSGSLLPGASMNVPMPLTINLSSGINFIFNASVTFAGDPLTSNDAIIPVSLSRLQGTVTVGVGENFSTLTAAIDAYNTSTICGPVVFSLTDANYPSETFPIVINHNTTASSTNTLTIKPASGNTSCSITGSGVQQAFIKLAGTDYVTIDGSHDGSGSRNLTITNNANGPVIWIGSPSATDSATNNHLQNCNIITAGSNNSYMVFCGSSVTTGSAALSKNCFNSVENCYCPNPVLGITFRGKSTANLDSLTIIKNNVLGHVSTINGGTGIAMTNQSSCLIEGNEIRNLGGGGSANGVSFTGVRNSQIINNSIHGLQQFGFSGFTTTTGILLTNTPFTTSGNASNNIVANNVIYDIQSGGLSAIVSGITFASGYNDKIYFNSVYLTGQLGTNTHSSACFTNSASSTNLVEVKNNAFYMGGYSPAPSDLYVHYTGTHSNYSGYAIDRNDLYISLTGAGTGYIGRLSSTNYSTFSSWQTASQKDSNSISVNPQFTSSYNLLPLAGSPLAGAGTPISGITTDILGNPRHPTAPAIGAYEIAPCDSVFYADADNDGYGNPAAPDTNCTQPPGYVSDNTDCNDTDSTVHTPQSYNIDGDHDNYGSTATAMVCSSIPTTGYSNDSTDCNDGNATIHPNASEPCNGIDDNCDLMVDNGSNTPPSFGYQGDYIGLVINKLIGVPGDEFTFKVIYTDAEGDMPASGYPRLYLDYEGNGIYTDANDRLYVMQPEDLNDNNVMDGKIYFCKATLISEGSNWKTKITVNDNIGCPASFGPFDYPDIIIVPDFEIFANDITFSPTNPLPTDVIIVTAIVHNNGGTDANNIMVHLSNEGLPSEIYSDDMVSIPAHGTANAQWVIPALVEGWYPMRVNVDVTDVIAESNEDNNDAVRPVTVGSPVLAGGIYVEASSFPNVSYISANHTVDICGRAAYYDLAIQLTDTSVAGGTVTVTIDETGATFTGYTNNTGHYCVGIQAPVSEGIYHLTVTVTDYTLTGDTTAQFELVLPPCNLDLKCELNLSSHTILVGGSISGSVRVTNVGCLNSTVATVANVYFPFGIPATQTLNIPPLAAGNYHDVPFLAVTYPFAVTTYIDAILNPTHNPSEITYNNNEDIEYITVANDQPDLGAGGGGGGFSECNPNNQINIRITNDGTAAIGNVGVFVIINDIQNNIPDTLRYTIYNIAAHDDSTWNIMYIFTHAGTYGLTIMIDPTTVMVPELSSLNNYYSTSFYVSPCYMDLVIGSCSIDVSPVDPQNSPTINISALVQNNGQLAVTEPFDVGFYFGIHRIVKTITDDIAAGGSLVVSTDAIPSPVMPQLLTIMVDSSDVIDEQSEANNDATGYLCHDFELKDTCRNPYNPYWWLSSYVVNTPVNMYATLRNNGLYKTDSTKIKFEVKGPGILDGNTYFDIGSSFAYNVNYSCTHCPERINLGYPYYFPMAGTYLVRMTADADMLISECDELNNEMIVTIQVTDLPDYRVLSEHINPSSINPSTGTPITVQASYENIGVGSATPIDFKLLFDNVPLQTMSVAGLPFNNLATVPFTSSWSSTIPGVHIIRTFIDAGLQITENNETNNEATRAIIVGSAPDVHWVSFDAGIVTCTNGCNTTFNGMIANDGDGSCDINIEYYYTNDQGQQVYIGNDGKHISGNSFISVSYAWDNIADQNTIVTARIAVVVPVESDYSDNDTTDAIATMSLSFITTNASCPTGDYGYASVIVEGGEQPVEYLWSNNSHATYIPSYPGIVSVTVTDANGYAITANTTVGYVPAPTITASGPIVFCHGDSVELITDADGDYYDWSTGATTQSITVSESGDYYVEINECPSSVQQVRENQCDFFVNLTVFIEGFYIGNGMMAAVYDPINQPTVTDQITLQLAKPVAPYTILYSTPSFINTDGTGIFHFNTLPDYGSYYLVVRTRNGLQTWSKLPVEINNMMVMYNFSTHQ